MSRESWVLGLAGVCFGVLIGWIIGSQSQYGVGGSAALVPQAQVQQASPAQQQPPQAGQAPGQGPAQGQSQGQNPTMTPSVVPLDEAQVKTLTGQAAQRPRDAQVRAQLGNLYFDAERYGDAIKWYEAALAIEPKAVNVSTDLAVSYYYTNQTDRALQQFEASLAIDPKHTKTMLNVGMVKAFGKQDLAGAERAWRQVVELAPDSPEGRAAKQALESLKAAHPETGAGAAAPAGAAPRGKT